MELKNVRVEKKTKNNKQYEILERFQTTDQKFYCSRVRFNRFAKKVEMFMTSGLWQNMKQKLGSM